MAKINSRQLIFTVQLIYVAVSFVSVEVNGFGGALEWGKQLTRSTARSLVKVPSMVMDGSQFATQKVAGTVGNVVSPVKPLKNVVDATGSMVSNVLGLTSRLLGKDVPPGHEVMFLYGRKLTYLGTSRMYHDAVKTVIGLALANVVLHAEDMRDEKPIDLNTMPVLRRVVRNLEGAGAERPDINDIVWLLGRNGKSDIPEEMETKILGAMKDTNGHFRTRGVIEDIRWIAQHPDGFYRLDDSECNDYKLNTDVRYTSCTIIHSPKFETMGKN